MRNMETIGRYLMIGGTVMFLAGTGIFLAAKFGLPLGRLPGDIRIEGKNLTFYFPLATFIILSILLTLILNLILRWRK